MALVRKRTIPTERPPPVGEVSANFCGQRGVTWSAQRIPTPSGTSSRDNLRQPMSVPVAVDTVVLLMMGVCAAGNMQSELSREIKFTAYSCICWLFQQRTYRLTITEPIQISLLHWKLYGQFECTTSPSNNGASTGGLSGGERSFNLERSILDYDRWN